MSNEGSFVEEGDASSLVVEFNLVDVNGRFFSGDGENGGVGPGRDEDGPRARQKVFGLLKKKVSLRRPA